MPKLFISYSRVDESFARQIAQQLSDWGADVWMDVEDIPAGANWSNAINEGLQQSELMILILTPESMVSTNVADEWQSYHPHKPIIPLLLRATPVHYQLKRMQYVDFLNQPFQQAANQLYGELTRKSIALKPIAASTSSQAIPVQPPLPEQKASGFLTANHMNRRIVAFLAVTVVIISVVLTRIINPAVPTALLSANSTPTSLEVAYAQATAYDYQNGNAAWTPITYAFEDGISMVLVPLGCFMMGSDIGREDEQPVSQQCFSQPFWIDQTEVTQADFERLDGQKANANGFDGVDRPVESISWFEARNFCMLRGARLPTEREWEYAARGPDELIYSWGNNWNAENAVWWGNSNRQTANVGSRPGGVSWVGSLDMSGNVWEWVSSIYLPYDSQVNREADSGERTDVLRVLRGGSWEFNIATDFRTLFRGWSIPDHGTNHVGFRCARSD